MHEALISELRIFIAETVETILADRIGEAADLAVARAFQRPLGMLAGIAVSARPTEPAATPQAKPRGKPGPKPKANGLKNPQLFETQPALPKSAQVSKLTQILQAAGGSMPAGELRAQLALSVGQYHAVVKEAKAAKLVSSTGQKRATQYHLTQKAKSNGIDVPATN